jgi:4-hydroxy-2-oxoglutarate aldolase
MTKKVTGVFAPISTPFIDDEIAFDQFKENIKKYSQTPLNGYLVLGSNGESKSLTEEEKLKLLEIVLREKAAHQLVMAGTGYESTRQTIAFSKKAQALGADLVSLVTPSYFKKSLTDDALIGYYTQVAEALSIPVFAYNAPGFTGLTLSAAVIETISQHPNIGGMKDTSPAGLAGYLEVCGDDFDVLAGSMNTLFIGLSLGASGGVISLANAFPEPCCALYAAFTGGDIATARQVHSRLFRLNKAVSGASGVAGVKYAMELGGYHGGNPRLPLLPIKDADKQRIKAAAEAAGVL